MRIISGRAGGRRLKSIKGTGTRPTLDRVKEAVFNILAPVISDSKCLDLFAGFGGLGLEAVSRGANTVTLVEKNYRNTQIIKENIELCNFTDRVLVETEDVFEYLHKCDHKYDLIFMDPPYGKGLVNKTITLLSRYNFLKGKGLIIAEHHKNDEIKHIAALDVIREKIYGDTAISIFQL